MNTGRGVTDTGILGIVNYIRNPPAQDSDRLEFVTEAEEHSTMQTLPGREVTIRDARTVSPSLDREGFQLVPHVSSVSDFDLIEADEVTDAEYSAEMTELLTRVTGAATVVMLGGGKKRYGEKAADRLASLTNAKPARYPHADNTDESAAALAELFASLDPELDLATHRRYAMFNVWRCVTPPPQDIPLAVCDARSVAEADELPVTAVTSIGGTDEFRHDTTSYVHNPEHRWFYFPDMTPAEVIIFKSHDTDIHLPRRVPHTAFDDPTCPPNSLPRASVEARGLALFE
jgi:hypothetical protein